MSDTSRRQSNRASRLARALAFSGTSGKIYPADRATELLEAIIEPGYRETIEGDNQKWRPALMRLCALYLTRQPSIRIDPVARFHLGNGARLERINWLGNNSPRGILESFGIMMNYLYDRDTVEDNYKAFVRGTIVRSPDVDALLDDEPMPGATEGGERRHAVYI